MAHHAFGVMSDELYVQRGGDGDPLLLLVHGLGATGELWNGLRDVLSARWPGRWVIPDLPGHGRSAALAAYSFGHLAATVACAVPSEGRVVSYLLHHKRPEACAIRRT